MGDASTPVLKIKPYRGWFGFNLNGVWEFRDLLYFLVWRDIKVRYKQTLIGAAWAVIQPAVVMIIFSIVFGRLAQIPTDGLPPPVFYYTALLPWTCFSTGLAQTSNTLVANQALLTKIYFPRIILLLAALAPGVLDFGVGFLVLCGLFTFYGIVPGLHAILVPGLLLVAVLTSLSIGVWLSPINAMYRDIRYAVPLLTQFLMFASPVIYPTRLVPERWRWLYQLNPMAGVLEGFRWSLTGQGQPPDGLFAVSVAGVLIILAAGLMFFRRIEGTLADVV